MYLKKPETVVFDPSNKDHRAAVFAFLKRRAWADSPLRFTHDPEYGSVADQVQSKLLIWYASQEEAKMRKRAERKEALEEQTSKGVTFVQMNYQAVKKTINPNDLAGVPKMIRKVAG